MKLSHSWPSHGSGLGVKGTFQPREKKTAAAELLLRKDPQEKEGDENGVGQRGGPSHCVHLESKLGIWAGPFQPT